MLNAYRQNNIFVTTEIPWLKDLRVTFHTADAVDSVTADIGECLLVSAVFDSGAVTLVLEALAPVTMQAYRITRTVPLAGALSEYHDAGLYVLINTAEIDGDIDSAQEIEPYCVIFDAPPDTETFSLGVAETGDSVHIQLSPDAVYIGIDPPVVTTASEEASEGLLTFNGLSPNSGDLHIAGKDLCTVQVISGALDDE